MARAPFDRGAVYNTVRRQAGERKRHEDEVSSSERGGQTGGRPSLLQGVMRGRRTKVQYLNGYVSDQGRQVGIATPFNDKVVELITRVPPGTLKPDPRNLEPLMAMLPK